MTIVGTYLEAASSSGCHLLKDGTNYAIYPYSITNGTYTAGTTDTTFPNGTSYSNMRISEDCSRISIGTSAIFVKSGTWSQRDSSTWLDTDSTLTYVLADTVGNIKKYSSATNTYSTVHTMVNVTLSASAKIASYSNRIIVYDISGSTVRIFTFVDNSNTFTQIFGLTFTVTSGPKVIFSSQLTKVLFHGITNSSLTAKFYYVNYDAN